MLEFRSIVGSGLGRLALVVLAAGTLLASAACGQKGPLYLPTDPAAANRATLPQTLNPARAASAPSAAPSPAPAASQTQ